MKFGRVMYALGVLLGLATGVSADVLYSQPASTTVGTLIKSSYWNPDGSDYDEYAWDSFQLGAAANITEVRWRGGNLYAPVADFEISIWASIAAGSQPDIGGMFGGRLAHYFVGGNANQTPAGTVGGTAMYDYSFVLPHAFAAAANTKYWIQIEAWVNGIPFWGMATATGGNGTHFHASAGAGDMYYFFGTGDCAFTLIGTPTACSAPTITQNPQPVSACPWSTATFTVGATGSGTLSYRWLQNGYPVYDGPNGGGHGGGAVISGATTATLTIQDPSYWADVGTYSCQVSNGCGPTVSGGALLTVNTGPLPVTNPSPVSACEGDAVQFAIDVSSVDPVAYRWQYNGVDIFDGVSPTGALISGSDTNLLTLMGVAPGDAGNYRCRSFTNCGSYTSPNAALTVNPLPGVLADPSAVNACTGGNAAFSTVASGMGITYQWLYEFPPASGAWVELVDGYVSGVGMISGATMPDLSISGVDGGASTNFACMIMNSCGVIITNPAWLRVGPTCDFNQDGATDTSDVLDIADAIASGLDPNPGCKDFNQDGSEDLGDVLDLADAIAAGTCP